MSLRMLQKQCGVEPSKAATNPAGAGSHGRGGGRGGYPKGGEEGGGGGYYLSASGNGDKPQEANNAPRVMAPVNRGGFRGSSAQAAHIEATKAAMREQAATASAAAQSTELAARSGLGLDALKERKQKEEDERQQRRDAARAKRHGQEVQREVEEEQALAECEEQARIDSEELGVKYEAALIVRIAVHFGTSGVWMKLAEARSRGAAIPLDPKRVYVLAHPDKCALPEASDATAILNAQRPPEMTEVASKPRAAATAPRSSTGASTASSKPGAARPSKADAQAAADESIPREGGESSASGMPAALQQAVEAVLEKAKLTRHHDKACSWCAEMGAIAFEEVIESAEDFASALGLKPLEKKRLLDALGLATQAAASQEQADDGESSTTAEATPSAPAASTPPKQQEAERRVDPEDGKSCSFEELREKYKGQYTPEDIEAYWQHDCKESAAKSEQASTSVSSRPAPKSRRY